MNSFDNKDPAISSADKEADKMKLTSPDFENNGMIPKRFTCQGEDISPKLIIENIPAGAKSLALSCKDPDAPMGTWVHWLVHDMPADKAVIDYGENPGTQITNSFGKEDYGGPCPPSGTHRYIFTVYALDVESIDDLNEDNFDSLVEEHTLEKAKLIGKYMKG